MTGPSPRAQEFIRKQTEINQLYVKQRAEIEAEEMRGTITKEDERRALKYILIKRDNALNAAHKKAFGSTVFPRHGKPGRKPKGVR